MAFVSRLTIRARWPRRSPELSHASPELRTMSSQAAAIRSPPAFPARRVADYRALLAGGAL